MTSLIDNGPHGENRRDFLHIATGTLAATALAATAWPLIDSMNPSADILSQASVEIDLSSLEPGQRITAKWRGQPIFIDRRTQATIQAVRSESLADLKDLETDEARAINPEYLVVIGVCTHLGCIPLGQAANARRGNWGGWFCPCHGSHYDQSGRIRKGPAPKNLKVPPYILSGDSQLIIG
ncbi:MAG: ubiquinol-cytochrome c reductase iron-sulfur subunit [Rhizobiaceae bacterium]|nr:ubiquinol-cytochrome c reductase iron-sulfur subunit [Rhizobiaceae bacterium]